MDHEEVAAALSSLPQEERLKILKRFCHGCGSDVLPCFCWTEKPGSPDSPDSCCGYSLGQ